LGIDFQLLTKVYLHNDKKKNYSVNPNQT